MFRRRQIFLIEHWFYYLICLKSHLFFLQPFFIFSSVMAELLWFQVFFTFFLPCLLFEAEESDESSEVDFDELGEGILVGRSLWSESRMASHYQPIHNIFVKMERIANGDRYIYLSTLSTYPQYQPLHNIDTDGANREWWKIYMERMVLDI